MAQSLFQLLDSNVTIQDDDGNLYQDTLTNLQTDYSACPTFSNDHIEYNKTLEIYSLDGVLQTYADNEDLDILINEVSTLIAAQTSRTTALCYYDDGLSFKTVASDYTVSDGEVLFTTTPTAAELEAAFSGYDAAALAAAQDTALETISDNGDTAYAAGFASTATGDTLYYDSDEKERLNYVAAANLAAVSATQFATSFPDGYPIHSRTSLTAADSTKVEQHLTATEMVQLGNDWITRTMEVKAQVWALKASVNACTDADSVTALDLSVS